MDATVSRIYTKDVVKINQKDDLAKADEVMNNYNIRHLPVVDDENFLVGILAKSDFHALRYVDSRFKGFKVKDVMTSPVKAVAPTSKVSEVAEIMMNNKINCVLVATKEEFLGILTSEDMLRILLNLLEDEEQIDSMDMTDLADEGWLAGSYT